MFADLFREIGDCRLPICISRTVAAQLFSRWNAISGLRIQKNGWALSSSDPALREYFEIVSRNVRRARARRTLEQIRDQMGRGADLNDPSDAELPPNVSGDLLLAQDSSPAFGPTWNVFPDPGTPSKRPRNPVSPDAAPDPKAARVAPTSAFKGGQDFANRHAMTTSTYLTTASDEQVRLAGREPTRGWPSFLALFPDGNPADGLHDPVFNQNFWNEAANDGWVAGTAMDPLAAALRTADAK